MSKNSKQSQSAAVARLSMSLSLIATIIMLLGAIITWKGYVYATSMVRTELAAQKIYFPPKGSPALSADEYPDLQQYAGQLVDTGPEARAYANEFIGTHLKKVANGKVYAEVSAEAQKEPTNVKLQQQKQTLFQGETLRGMLLGNGYGYWLMGTIAQYAALAMAAGATSTALLSLYFFKKQF